MAKYKAFADDKLNHAKMIISVLNRVKNIVGKGENAGLLPFSPFPKTFSKGFFLRVVKSRDCDVKELIIFVRLMLQGNKCISDTKHDVYPCWP